MTPIVNENLLRDMMGNCGSFESGEALIASDNTSKLPCGSFVRWKSE